MHVVATAGHVDHGKSTLVRALTGMEPDRWAEERRRGMTIDLGFAWATLPSGRDVAFVDVPGHERFVVNMLAGVGPVPAVMFVVAADEGWKQQSEEHLEALDALGVGHGLLVVTKADAADAASALHAARRRLATTSLAGSPEVVVSGVTGAGLDALGDALDRMLAVMPTPPHEADVRLWVDRSFTIRGAGTVVTGTLPAGSIRVGDELEVMPGRRTVIVRDLQSRNHAVPEAEAVSRVAVNLRGVAREDVRRGMALVTPGAWTQADEVDVVLSRAVGPADLVAHIGSAAVPVRLRPLGRAAARLRLASAVPVHVGDRLLLRDPSRHVVVARADVADVTPVRLVRRGDAARLATTLTVPGSADDVLRRRGVVQSAELRAAGIGKTPSDARRVGEWWVSRQQWSAWGEAIRARVADDADPLSPGVSLDALRRAVGLPHADVVAAVVAEEPSLRIETGRVRSLRAPSANLPALDVVAKRLSEDPFDAPTADELAAWGLGRPQLAHAVRAGRLLHLGGGVYVAPHAPDAAVERLRGLGQPFTVSAAREALGSSRRVVVPLLEHLDAGRRTRKLSDGTRFVVSAEG